MSSQDIDAPIADVGATAPTAEAYRGLSMKKKCKSMEKRRCMNRKCRKTRKGSKRARGAKGIPSTATMHLHARAS